jgi:hypothetical protein
LIFFYYLYVNYHPFIIIVILSKINVSYSHQNGVQKIGIFASMMVSILMIIVNVLAIIQISSTALITSFSVRVTEAIAFA